MMFYILVLLILVDVILSLFAMFLVYKLIKRLTTYIECDGNIVGFRKKDSTLVDSESIITVVSTKISYNVNGIDYEFFGNYYNPSMKIGDKIKILYNKNNVKKVTVKKGIFVAPVIVSILALYFIIGTCVFYIVVF